MQLRDPRVHRHNRATALSVLAAACASILPVIQPAANAITRRTDLTDQSYIDLGNLQAYAAVGALTWHGSGASATLISPKWIVSAGHTTATPEDVHTFTLGSTWSGPDQYHSDLVFNAGYAGDLTAGNDIGLIRLDTIVTTTAPASRYFGTQETGLTGTFVGYGLGGTGATGQNGSLFPYGIKRAGENTIDILGGTSLASAYSSNILFSDFDDPGNVDGHDGIPGSDTNPLAFEGNVAGGDSGGGLFFKIGNRSFLSGVTSFYNGFPQPEGDYNGTTFSINASYSDGSGATRVTIYNQWIDDNIVHYWTSAPSGGSFTDNAGWTLTAGTLNGHIAPSDGDIAGFKTSGSYTLTFNAGTTTNNYQLLARSGNVTMNLNGGTYNLTSAAYNGGIVIGRYNNESASVTFLNGVVNSHDIILGQMEIQNAQAAPSGQLIIGSGATVNVTGDPSTGVNGDVYVGGTFSGAGGSATVTIQSATSALNVAGRLRVYNGNRVNYNAGSLSVGTLEMGMGTIGGGQLIMSAGANKVLRTKSVTFDTVNIGKIDLADNDMIIDYDGASPLNSIRSYITSGYANAQWNGPGINSNSARFTQFIPPRAALGYGEASVLGFTNFDGFAVDSTTVLVKYTWSGDANLDGLVDIKDLQKLSLAWNLSGMWSNGDFNYDGVVNLVDLTLLAGNWQRGVGSPLSEAAFTTALTSLGLPASVAVPEPGGILTALVGAAMLGRRRRRQS